MPTSTQPTLTTPRGGGFGLATNGDRSAPRPGHRGTLSARGRAGLAMTTPFLALYAAFFLAPFVYSVVLSLRSPQTGGFVGLFNYRNVVGNGQFWSAVERMAYFGMVQVTAMIVLAIILASAWAGRAAARRLLRAPACRPRSRRATRS
ncbi:MAG: hypothetical protein ACRDZX_04350 [Acidimicrobiales bacterium]